MFDPARLREIARARFPTVFGGDVFSLHGGQTAVSGDTSNSRANGRTEDHSAERAGTSGSSSSSSSSSSPPSSPPSPSPSSSLLDLLLSRVHVFRIHCVKDFVQKLALLEHSFLIEHPSSLIVVDSIPTLIERVSGYRYCSGVRA